ncbi:twin transmembrane helix small protein [Undibacterium amnicola]|jgi:glycerol uptake facilitator-like aquaporin|uniref:Twin transmembrane helix small protein n=1 Tax=Undibacterium amnicola TaxID=1834038 RepID=A0ABR6XRU7_9BURK|nr:twin transmembrane helix small protein [Undibacterium amnicola]MBC3832118.1 twin transmembrane helix small protein [Undibacterium amnicola]
MKILVAIAFLLIFFSLGSALVYLMKDKGKSNRTVKALAFRVGFSVSLFVLILIANHYGLIQPTGIR